MKIPRLILLIAIVLAPVVARGQGQPEPAAPAPADDPPETIVAQRSQSEVNPPPPPAAAMVRTGGRIGGGAGPVIAGSTEFGPNLGAWWKNSAIASKLQLTDEQVKKISQTYLDHRLKLIDLQADLDKQELRLQPLLDIDQPDESKVGSQIDLVTAARRKLEKENAMMMLDIRRWLSVEQWKKLKALAPAEPGPHNVFFYRGSASPGGPGVNFEGSLPAPLPQDMPADWRAK
jgi:Spy/CpxP family protein refolding chaperone